MLVKSATVSVKAQKYGGLWDQPIGRVSGMATRGSVEGALLGITTARLRAVEGADGMR